MGNFMKRVIAFLTTIILLVMSVQCVFAESKVSFECGDKNCDNNRLVTIDVKADCDKKLCAATFEFTYDKSMFEYRSIKVVDDESMVTANELDNSIKVVYLNTYGKEINNKSTIFTITLKSINSGSGYLDFTVSDCVDSEVNSISVGSCTSAKITVNGTNADNGNANDKNDKNSSNKNDDSNSGKSNRKDSETSTTTSSYDEMGLLNPIKDRNCVFLMLGSVGAGVLVGIVFVAFKVGKSSAEKKNKDDKNGTSEN